VTIDVLRTGEGPQRTFQVKLTNARIATIATSTTTDQLAEHLTLAAETSTLSYWPQRPDGSLGPPVAATVACDGR
jgi:type VI protein secretion system component Hcp